MRRRLINLKRIVAVLAVAVAALVSIVLIRTATVASLQTDVAPAEAIALDARRAVERLSGAIRFKTISYQDQSRVDGREFLRLHRYLEQAFPALHAALERDIVADYSLLYTWQGSAPELSPILLMAHMDVVPIEAGAQGSWTHPPFAGAVADGFVWGRGTLDMKQAILGYFEAIEWLLGEGFRPRRTVYFALHHDEEVGGERGAVRIAALLQQRDVRLEFTLDEGSVITHGIVPGVQKPVALIAVSEKGYLTVALTATGEGGHSSRPPRGTAVAQLARALHRLESRQMPAELRFPASGIFDHLASEMPLSMRIVMANRWLFEPLLLSRLAEKPATNAIIRTTTAATMLETSGVKENVLPTEAKAIVNFRLLPGDSVQDVLEHLRATIDDTQVTIATVGRAQEASPVSDVGSAAFVALDKTIRQVFPDVLVAPGLVIGGTDSRHYRAVAENSYRFLPVRLAAQDLQRIHGRDERIAVRDYVDSIRFYVRLLRNVAGGRVDAD